MEPQIIDTYNEYPYGINVIEELNNELEKVQQENNELNTSMQEGSKSKQKTARQPAYTNTRANKWH